MKLAQKSEFSPQKWSLNTKVNEFPMKMIGSKNSNISFRIWNVLHWICRGDKMNAMECCAARFCLFSPKKASGDQQITNSTAFISERWIELLFRVLHPTTIMIRNSSCCYCLIFLLSCVTKIWIQMVFFTSLWCSARLTIQWILFWKIGREAF